MGDLHEIVDINQVSRLFMALALVTPLCGLVIGFLMARRRSAPVKSVVTAIAFGVSGPLNLLMWQVFNALSNANGIDTVRNLAICLAVFLGAGAALGAIYALIVARQPQTLAEDSTNISSITLHSKDSLEAEASQQDA